MISKVWTSGTGTIAESDESPPTAIVGTNSAVAYSAAGRVYRVNDRQHRLFRGARGTATRNTIAFNNQWIDERFQGTDNLTFSATGATEAFAIAAPKTTDVMRIRASATTQGLQLDPLAGWSSVKAAYYSAAFIFRSLAAEKLDTDPEEIDVSNVRQIELADQTKGGEIVLSDHLANGSGFVSWIHDRWPELLLEATSNNHDPSSFMGSLTSAAHRASCNSSNYDCLRQYRNMVYHSLLDWRLGLGLLRSFASSGYLAGLDGNFGFPELEGWAELATSLRDTFCVAFPVQAITLQDGLPAFTAGDLTVIVVHPFWDTRAATGILAQARADVSTRDTKYADTFNLLRRQSWVYQQLLST